MNYSRVAITDQAAELLQQLIAKHGRLLFHQSGGCCDGSAPMLLEEDDFYTDDNDVLVGELLGVKFFMSADQFEYWKHTQLTVEGRGASFSLEISLGVRFIIRSRLIS